jgi:hypothetical protein
MTATSEDAGSAAGLLPYQSAGARAQSRAVQGPALGTILASFRAHGRNATGVSQEKRVADDPDAVHRVPRAAQSTPVGARGQVGLPGCLRGGLD